MLVYGLSQSDVHQLVNIELSPAYAFNLRAVIGHSWSTRYGWRTRFVLRAKDSRYEPARRALSGRRTVACSWSCQRDVLRYLFDHGATRVVTALADYRRETFEDQYPTTKYKNIGSTMYPAQWADLEDAPSPPPPLA